MRFYSFPLDKCKWVCGDIPGSRNLTSETSSKQKEEKVADVSAINNISKAQNSLVHVFSFCFGVVPVFCEAPPIIWRNTRLRLLAYLCKVFLFDSLSLCLRHFLLSLLNPDCENNNRSANLTEFSLTKVRVFGWRKHDNTWKMASISCPCGLQELNTRKSKKVRTWNWAPI